MEWSKEGRGTWQVALGLSDTRLVRDGTNVVRREIENLIKLSQCFGKRRRGIYKSACWERRSTSRGSRRSASLKYDSLRSHWPRLRVT